MKQGPLLSSRRLLRLRLPGALVAMMKAAEARPSVNLYT
jgi:hypothetical protein